MNPETLIKENDRLIKFMAAKLNVTNDDFLFQELCQIGKIAILSTYQNFSPDKGTLSNFLGLQIKFQMISYLDTYKRTIRIPKNIIYSDIDLDDLPATRVLSLDVDNDDGASLKDVIEDVVEDKSHDDAQELKLGSLRHYLTSLNPEYQLILKRHYFEYKSFAEIAKELGSSKQNVSQKYLRALEILRKKMIKKV